MHLPAGRNPQFAAGIGQPEQDQHLETIAGVEPALPANSRRLLHFDQGYAGDRQQEIDRHGLGLQLAQPQGQLDHVGVLLAHADDPAGADFQPRLADRPERVEPILIRVRRADAGIEPLARVEVVVDPIDAARLQPPGLFER